MVGTFHLREMEGKGRIAPVFSLYSQSRCVAYQKKIILTRIPQVNQIDKSTPIVSNLLLSKDKKKHLHKNGRKRKLKNFIVFQAKLLSL